MNIFIIYALRKLKKLNNISFWFLYCLSISDFLVGLSGFALDISSASCPIRLNWYWIRYFFEVRSYFLGYSARLTTIIAIDRSIRMKYLFKYNSIMTKTKANLILMTNAVLGTVNFVGSLGSHKDTFDMVYLIFHFICIAFGCMLYIFTYCNIKENIADLHANMQRNRLEPTNDSGTRSNENVPSSQPKAEDKTDETKSAHGGSRCQNAFHLIGAQERNNEINQPQGFSIASSKRSKQLNEMPERSIENNASKNDGACTCLHSGNNKMADQGHGDQNIASESTAVHIKTEKNRKNLNNKNHRRANENDIGRAMLFIAMTITLCYIPICVEGLLQLQNVENAVLDHLAMILLLINSSCNAVILTVFSREIRNLAITFFRS